MAGMTLKDIRTDFAVGNSVADELDANSRVIFAVRGRFGSNDVARQIRGALDSKIDAELDYDVRQDMIKCIPDGKRNDVHVKLAAQGKKFETFRNLFDLAVRDLLNDASANGFDAIAHYASTTILSTGERKKGAILTQEPVLIASGYASVIIAYSTARNEICAVVQNIVTLDEAAKLDERYKRLNRHIGSRIMPESPVQELDRKVDDSAQPLLTQGGPIGECTKPLSTLGQDFVHEPLDWINVSTAKLLLPQRKPVLFSHDKPDPDLLAPRGEDDDPLADIRAALKEALHLQVEPRDIQLFTVAIRSAVPEMR